MLLHYLVIYRQSLVFDINLLQGSVATYVRNVGIFNSRLIANLLWNQAVKEFRNSVKI